VIYDVHEDYGKQILSKPYIPKSVRKVISSLIKVLEYISPRFFDSIITTTDDILRNFVYHKRAISVRNFPIVAYFPNPARFDRESKDAFNLIYVGGLTEIRGIVQIVQALELVDSNKQLKLIMYGKFDPPEFELEVRSLKEFERVEYLGWVEPEKIPELLTKVDVGIVVLHPISNYLTSLPIKLFEYMSAGLPVVASNFSLWKEIVDGNCCGICVDPLKPKEIAEAIEYLMGHPEEARKMGENGRKAVLEKYNWENESKKLLKLYEEILWS
ncbi:MAG: glycosyltransferase family 4 protein, partial [Actinobacteria bacterium]|nr:glycosyltransferase family 4 protein [Actinomycetota bacterium]